MCLSDRAFEHIGDVLMKKSYAGLFVAGALLATLASGCTSKPSAAELKQLEDLKATSEKRQSEESA